MNDTAINDRDWSEVPYVRVYYSVITDRKFLRVYHDDAALAGYLRLLISADQAWPMPAELPAWLGRRVLKLLAEVGLLIQQGSMYRMSGLDKERQSRFGQGKGRSRYPSDGLPKAEPTRSHPESGRSETGVDSESNRSLAGAGAHSASVSSSDVTTEGGPGGTHPLLDAIHYIEGRSGRQFAYGEGSKVWDTLSADVRDFSWAVVEVEMRALTAKYPDAGQLVFGASRRLHRIESPPKEDTAPPDPEYVAAQLAAQREERRKARSNA